MTHLVDAEEAYNLRAFLQISGDGDLHVREAVRISFVAASSVGRVTAGAAKQLKTA